MIKKSHSRNLGKTSTGPTLETYSYPMGVMKLGSGNEDGADRYRRVVACMLATVALNPR